MVLSLCPPSLHPLLCVNVKCLEAGWHLFNEAWEAPSVTHMHIQNPTLKNMQWHLILCVCESIAYSAVTLNATSALPCWGQFCTNFHTHSNSYLPPPPPYNYHIKIPKMTACFTFPSLKFQISSKFNCWTQGFSYFTLKSLLSICALEASYSSMW